MEADIEGSIEAALADASGAVPPPIPTRFSSN